MAGLRIQSFGKMHTRGRGPRVYSTVVGTSNGRQRSSHARSLHWFMVDYSCGGGLELKATLQGEMPKPGRPHRGRWYCITVPTCLYTLEIAIDCMTRGIHYVCTYRLSDPSPRIMFPVTDDVQVVVSGCGCRTAIILWFLGLSTHAHAHARVNSGKKYHVRQSST